MESADPDVSLNSARVFVEVEKPDELEASSTSMRAPPGRVPRHRLHDRPGAVDARPVPVPSAAEVGLKVKGKDLDRLKEISEDLVAKLSAIPGIADLATNIGEGKPEFRVTVRKDALEKIRRA